MGRTILNQAVEDGKIRVNPCRVKGAGSERSPERPIAMPDEVLAIADGYRPLVLMAAWCSLRFGELAGLRRSQVDFLHRPIRVSAQAVELACRKVVFKGPKTGSARTVAVPLEFIPILEDHLAEHVAPICDALVFISPARCAVPSSGRSGSRRATRPA